MKRSTRAVLLSGLVFPGLGHIFLKQYLRGSILVLIALATASVIIRFAVRQAQVIVDGVVSGDISVDAGAMTELLSSASSGSSGSDSTAVTVSTIIFGACWLIGIVDSYRVGIALDNSGKLGSNRFK